MSRVLLDTHVWVWLLIGHPRLSERARESIQRAQSFGGVFVSAIST